MSEDLAGQFVVHLCEENRASIADMDALREMLAGIVREVREKWPGFEVPVPEFLGHLASCIPKDSDVPKVLEQIYTGDLYLALACAKGDKKAIEAMQKQVIPALRGAIKRGGARSPEVEDIEQKIWDIVLTPRKDQPPRVIQYRGRASLKNWVGVIAARETYRLMNKNRQDRAHLQELAEQWSGQDEDEELLRIKQMYRAQFKAAMEQALSNLSSRDRNLLRMHLIDGLSPPQIGALHKVHRFTAYRWLLGIREKLLKSTRQTLRNQLGLSGEEFESIIRLINSRLEASIQRFLEPSMKTEEGILKDQE